MGSVKDLIFSKLREAVSRGTSTLEWAVQNGALSKLWVSGSLKTPRADVPVQPEDTALVGRAIEMSLAARHSTVSVAIRDGKVEDVIFTDKANLGSDSDRLREPRRP